MPSKSLPEVASKVFDLLNPLESEDRRKVVSGVFALLGEVDLPAKSNGRDGGSNDDDQRGLSGGQSLGTTARRWMKQNGLTSEIMEQVFHFDPAGVEIIANAMPGQNKKQQTINAYLMMGVKRLLESDSSTFTDKDALALCKHYGCYDSNNHTTNRKALGNKVAGDRRKGFSLPNPGLKAAAEVIRQIAGEAAS